MRKRNWRCLGIALDFGSDESGERQQLVRSTKAGLSISFCSAKIRKARTESDLAIARSGSNTLTRHFAASTLRSC